VIKVLKESEVFEVLEVGAFRPAGGDGAKT
jgi:hypothetical protein